MQERKDGIAPRAYAFQRAPDAEIAARRDQSFFEDLDRFLRPSALLIDFRQVQVQLSVVMAERKSFAAKVFRVGEASFG